VYRQYSQEQLNDQYNTRLRVPDYADYFERWERLSGQARQQNTILKDISFGEHPKECMDIFPSQLPLSKTIVFIHGGYWHLLDKAMFHFLADHFLKYDVTTVLINYPLAPEALIDEIVLSCQKAIRWLYDNIVQFNGDSSQLYVLGHSAGGHLASMLLVEKELKFIKAVISLSGLFRLEPVMLSYHNDAIGMNHDTAIRNSPVLLKPVHDCPVLLSAGTEETEEFKTQSEELYDCWKSKCNNIEMLKVPGENHYSILDAVIDKNSVLQKSIIRLMELQGHTV